MTVLWRAVSKPRWLSDAPAFWARCTETRAHVSTAVFFRPLPAPGLTSTRTLASDSKGCFSCTPTACLDRTLPPAESGHKKAAPDQRSLNCIRFNVILVLAPSDYEATTTKLVERLVEVTSRAF